MKLQVEHVFEDVMVIETICVFFHESMPSISSSQAQMQRTSLTFQWIIIHGIWV